MINQNMCQTVTQYLLRCLRGPFTKNREVMPSIDELNLNTIEFCKRAASLATLVADVGKPSINYVMTAVFSCFVYYQ